MDAELKSEIMQMIADATKKEDIIIETVDKTDIQLSEDIKAIKFQLDKMTKLIELSQTNTAKTLPEFEKNTKIDQMTRQEFESLDNKQKSEFFTAGGTIKN